MKTFLFLGITILFCVATIAQNKTIDSTNNIEKSKSFSEKMCPINVADETGKILPGNTIKIEKKITTTSLTISVIKNEGNARATASIYLDDTFVDRLVFNPGDKKTTLTKNLSEVTNKTIRIEIQNQSKEGYFEFRAIIESESESLLNTGTDITGRLLGQTKKTITSVASCSNKASLIIKRTDGKARASIKIWKEKDKGWELLDTKTFESLQPNNKLVLNYNTSKPLKVEIKNISINETFNYNIDVIAVK